MRFGSMFITAVCVLFLLKLRWPRKNMSRLLVKSVTHRLSFIIFVYVTAWATAQLRINFTRIFKVFTTIWKTLKIQVKLILNCPRAIAITCLSHKEQNYAQTKVLPFRKQVWRLSLKNRLAVELEKPTIIVSKTQQVQFT